MATNYSLIPKDFAPGNIPPMYGDVYNTVVEVNGFRTGGTIIERLKEEAGYVTDYPTADKAVNTIISMQNNIENIISNQQPPIFDLAGPTMFEWDNDASTSTASHLGSPAVEITQAGGVFPTTTATAKTHPSPKYLPSTSAAVMLQKI